MICMMNLGDVYDVRCGTPMIQVIPFRRDEWTSGLGTIDVARRDEPQAELVAKVHAPS
jgi:hypothetical protein